MGNRYLKSGTGGTASPYESDTTAAVTLATLTALGLAVDEVIWVDSAHAESSSATTNYTAPASATREKPLRMLAVTDFDASPGTLASKSPQHTVGNGAVTSFDGLWHIHGCRFNSRGGLTGTGTLNFGNSSVTHSIKLVDCTLRLGGSASGVTARLGPAANTSNDDVSVTLDNVSLEMTDTTTRVLLRHGSFYLNNVSMPGGTSPTTVFTFQSGCLSYVTLENSDLSGSSWTNLFGAGGSTLFKAIVRNCKFPSGWVAFSGTLGIGCEIDIDNCDDGDTNYIHRRYRYAGSVREDTGVYATTDPASDGTTPLSWKMTSLVTCSIFEPLYSEWIHVWVDDTATAITPSLQILVGADGAAALTDGKVWLECDAMDTASTPLGTRTTDRVSQVIDTPANQAAGSTAWTGDGYTTERTHTLAVASFTPNKKGFVRCRVALATASTDIYINPVIGL